MPLFVDGNGKTRVIEWPEPYPPVIILPKPNSLSVFLGDDDFLSPIKTVEFRRTSPMQSDVDAVIYESKEGIF